MGILHILTFLFALFPFMSEARRREPEVNNMDTTDSSASVMVSLTDDNFATYLDDDTERPVLVSFCTSTPQCMEFTTMYRKLSEEILKNINLGNIENITGIVLAHCDISDNPVLVSRFEISRMPTLFYRKNGRAYMFNKKVSKNEIFNFVLYTHLEAEPLGLLTNPFGIVGEAKALKAFVYMNSRRLLPVLSASTGLSPLMVLLTTIISGSILLLIVSFSINYLCI